MDERRTKGRAASLAIASQKYSPPAVTYASTELPFVAKLTNVPSSPIFTAAEKTVVLFSA